MDSSFSVPPSRVVLTGRHRSGKGMLAKELVKNFGYTEKKIAQPLYDMVSDMDVIVSNDTTTVRLSQLRQAVMESGGDEEYFWNFVKDNFPILRNYLNSLGLAIRREDSSLFIRRIENEVYSSVTPVVVSDAYLSEELNMFVWDCLIVVNNGGHDDPLDYFESSALEWAKNADYPNVVHVDLSDPNTIAQNAFMIDRVATSFVADKKISSD